MIAFRYRLKNVPMKIAEKSFTADGIEFPAGSFVITDMSRPADGARRRRRARSHGRRAVDAAPTVADARRRRAAHRDLLAVGRHAEPRLVSPHVRQVRRPVRSDLQGAGEAGNLQGRVRRDPHGGAEPQPHQRAAGAGRAAQPYQKSDKYKFLGMYGETADMTGGFGQEGVDAFAAFLEAGGTLIAVGRPRGCRSSSGGRARSTEGVTGVNAQRPLVQGEIARPEHPVFYGYANKMLPVKYVGGQPFFRVGMADEGNVLARYVGGDASVLSGLMTGADPSRPRPFAVDMPEAPTRARAASIMFSNNPIYRWQNHGEFNMVFNSIINWNDR